MLNVFLDANVIIDFLAERENFFEDAAIIFSLGVNNKLKLHTASMSLATASYILSKNNDTQIIKDKIKEFCKLCKINIVDGDCVKYATESEFDDFEDAMQYRCAQKIKADYIVTRNTKDFATAEIRTRSPHNFLIEVTAEE